MFYWWLFWRGLNFFLSYSWYLETVIDISPKTSAKTYFINISYIISAFFNKRNDYPTPEYLLMLLNPEPYHKKPFSRLHFPRHSPSHSPYFLYRTLQRRLAWPARNYFYPIRGSPPVSRRIKNNMTSIQLPPSPASEYVSGGMIERYASVEKYRL